MNRLKKTIMTVMSGAFLTACAATANTAATWPAYAGEQPNVIVFGEDADGDSIPRDSRVFKRVLNALSEELQSEGFAIYDETYVTLDDYKQGRVRRTDAEIIDIGRSIQRPTMDVGVIYTIYASVNELNYTTKVRTRIEGRLLNLRTGRRMGNFEVVSPDEWRAPKDCDRDCILETVGDHAKTLGRDLGAVLTSKLDAWSPRGDEAAADNSADSSTGNKSGGMCTAMTLKFTGFKPEEVNQIEELIVSFKGYEHHRPINMGMRTAEYWYETCSDYARVSRNLRKSMEYLGVEARVSYSGSVFDVEKINTGATTRR